jgi:hypothetical protein
MSGLGSLACSLRTENQRQDEEEEEDENTQHGNSFGMFSRLIHSPFTIASSLRMNKEEIRRNAASPGSISTMPTGVFAVEKFCQDVVALTRIQGRSRLPLHPGEVK